MGQATQHSIQQRRRATGPSAEQLAELRALWGSVSAEEVAARLHIHRATAYRWAKRAGVVARQVASFGESVAVCWYTVASLASALGVSPLRIARWVRWGWLTQKPRKDADTQEVYDFSDTGVWKLIVHHPFDVFPNGATPEQVAWLVGMQRTAHQGRVRESA